MRSRLTTLMAALAMGILWMSGAAVTRAQQPAEKSIPDKVKLFIPYKDYTAGDNQRILDMFKYLRVADVSDGMDVVGLQDVGLVDPEIHALWKDTERFTHRVVGIAVTARYMPAFMDVLTPGSILMIDAMEDGESRSIGSSNIQSWQKRGMVGLVTSGGLADTDEIIHQKIPTYFRRLAAFVRAETSSNPSIGRSRSAA